MHMVAAGRQLHKKINCESTVCAVHMLYSLAAQTAFFFYIGEGKGSGQMTSTSW